MYVCINIRANKVRVVAFFLQRSWNISLAGSEKSRLSEKSSFTYIYAGTLPRPEERELVYIYTYVSKFD